MKEYLVEVTKSIRHWIKAEDKYEAEEIAEDLEDDGVYEIENITVIDSREIEDDDYERYLDDEDENEELEEW